MQRIRYVAAAVTAALCALALAAPAAAWEFNMKGAFYWEFDLWSQQGRGGFFGPFDVDAGAGAVFDANSNAVVRAAGFYAPYNFWVGLPDVGVQGVVSGEDASWNTMYMLTDMDLRINPAIRVRGTYFIGSWATPEATTSAGQLVHPEYLNYSASGIQRSFSPGYWNTLWLAAELPWGIFAIGKRPSTFGMALGWDGTENRSSESFSLFSGSGPIRIGFSIYPSRRSGTGGEYYNQNIDKTNGRAYDIGMPTVTYRSGPVDMGILLNVVDGHTGGEGRVGTPAARQIVAYRDRQELYGGAYFKYYTGMIFFNTEVDFYQQTNRNRRKTAGGAPQAGVRDTYIEHWRFATEAAALSGPARVGLLFAWLQGDDRRGNQFSITGAQAVGNVTYIDKRGTLRSNSFSNTSLFEPYGYLLTTQYGTGMFVNTDTNNGYIEDAVLYGARADYSIAANLSVWGSFLWAERQSKSGWGWGCISPDTSVPSTQAALGQAAAVAADGRIVRRGIGDVSIPAAASTQYFGNTDRVGAPNIPATNLGWEIDLGLNWKLLENFSVKATAAYWKPGDWFKWACIDKSVVGWGAPGPAGLLPTQGYWGINPSRSIDPVYGVYVSLTGSF